ncbi:MAG: deoxynucleoside kinase, partial [Segatella copri]|nr:deoxynucleoside kinase [Segatella copri]
LSLQTNEDLCLIHTLLLVTQKMPLDYLEGINNLYEDFIMNKYKGKVLIVEVDNLDFEHNPKQFGEIIDKIDAKLFGLFS